MVNVTATCPTAAELAAVDAIDDVGGQVEALYAAWQQSKSYSDAIRDELYRLCAHANDGSNDGSKLSFSAIGAAANVTKALAQQWVEAGRRLLVADAAAKAKRSRKRS